MRNLISILLFIFVGCATAQLTTPNHSPVFIEESRFYRIKSHLAVEPVATAWKQVLRRCEAGLTQKGHAVSSWAIPGYYDDPEEHERAVAGLNADANLAYEEALCYRLTDDDRFSKASASLLDEWASTLKISDPSLVDTKLSMNEFFTPMILAADLMPVDWSGKNRFRRFLYEIVLPLNTMAPKHNNHADWGVLLVLSLAAYTDDAKLFGAAEARFNELLKMQIRPDGTLEYEYDRSDGKNWNGGPTRGKKGIWYSNYALAPIAMASEILRVHGHVKHFDERVHRAFRKVAEWNRFPERFPFYASNGGSVMLTRAIGYFEILNRQWPEADARELLEQWRTLPSAAGIPDLTLTHGI